MNSLKFLYEVFMPEARFPDEKFWNKDGSSIYPKPKGIPKGTVGTTGKDLKAGKHTSNVCPGCKTDQAGYEYPNANDNGANAAEWQRCPDCGDTLPHKRGDIDSPNHKTPDDDEADRRWAAWQDDPSNCPGCGYYGSGHYPEECPNCSNYKDPDAEEEED
jgi:hypothetical protein